MKRIITTAMLLLSAAMFSTACAMPVYTDDLPADYIQKANAKQKWDASQQFTYSTSEENAVKIYTDKTIKLTGKPYGVGRSFFSQVTPKIDDKINFIIAEDVYKNKQLFIKKGTIATGTVIEANLPSLEFNSPAAFTISLFTTKDVNGQPVKLYGKISREDKMSFMAKCMDANTGTGASQFPANKKYTLYYK